MKHFQDILPINSTIKRTISELEPFFTSYDITLENSVFFDIETTGLSADYCSIYIIGFLTFKEDSCLRQIYFAENPKEEAAVLAAFFHDIEPYHHLIHFNGDGFDIPFLRKKSDTYHISCQLDNMTSFDIFKQVRRFKNIMQLENAKQKSFETFLQINRKDTYSGGELIQIYKNYVKSPLTDTLQILLQHNLDDLEGMLLLLPVLLYPYALETAPDNLSYEINQYLSIQNTKRTELLIEGHLPIHLPVSVSIQKDEYYLKADTNHIYLRCVLMQGEYKHFYENYKDYYYLPLEDTAIHKSVAEFVDKAYRKKASKSTCYTKTDGLFVPIPDAVLEPLYKTDCKSKKLLLPVEQLEKENALTLYVQCVLKYLKP